MQTRQVRVVRSFAAPADVVWSVVGQFVSDWHPLVESCTAHPVGPALDRVMVLSGSDQMRERLTYRSCSDRELGYRMVSGIADCARYDGWVTVQAREHGCDVLWRAKFTADDARADDIAAGTEDVFEAGLVALDNLSAAQPVNNFPSARSIEALSRQAVAGLSVLSAPGLRAKTLVLCVHGIGGQAENWEPQLRVLGDRHWIAALDLRGYGHSAPGPGGTRVEAPCADILAVADALKAEKVVLVGLSMGAWIATSFAMRHPDRLAGLVLAGGCTGMSEASETVRQGFLETRSAPLLAGGTPGDLAEDVVSVIAGPCATQAQSEKLRSSMAAIPRETYLDALTCFCTPRERFDFSKLTCPVLMVAGEHDRLAPPEEIRGVAHRIHNAMQEPDVQFEVIERAGHVCNLEQAEAFNAHLSGFLQRFPGTQRPTDTRAARKRAKTERILAASLAEFAAKGFDGASMDRMAQSAGVSKPTLYQYFGGKEHLFAAVLDQGRKHLLMPLSLPDGDLVDRLWGFSWTYADFVLRSDMLSLARLILGEAGRRPETAVAYHRAGPGRALAGLTEFIQNAIQDGDLRSEDPEMVAEDLWSLILSSPRDHHLHHVKDVPDPEKLFRRIKHGLTIFLRAYATHPRDAIARLDSKTHRP